MSDLTLRQQVAKLIDTSAWRLDDKEWVKNRKAKWRELSKVIKQDKKMSAKDVNSYKNYYLTGQLDGAESDRNYKEFNPIICMMFHADQTEKGLTKVFEDCAFFRSELSFSRYIEFFKRMSPTMSLGLNEQGYLDGNEAIYCKLLYGETEEQFSKLRESRNDLIFPAFCSASNSILLDQKYYIHSYYKYLLDFSFYCSNIVDYSWGRVSEEVDQFLQLIAYYEQLDPFKEVDEERYQAAWSLVNQVREKLQRENLPDELKTRWQYAQTPEGKAQEYEYYQERYPLLKQLTKSESV
ncbi:hypothetical protein [Algibacillus agarilyticus]|uniref:hypothetical protein n=1 Tax=Algibacillus agarilyticus TaxID=2234133 RepID=UPI000DCFE936|nr:hypothetical protein [Algibacillus agarilyticus]